MGAVLNRAVIISVGIGLVLSGVLVWKVGLENVLHTFLDADPWFVLGYLGVSVLIAVGLTIKWHAVLSAYGVRLPFYTLFIYRLIGYAVSYVTPASHIGGEPVRAVLLQKQGIPFKLGLSSAIVDRAIDLIFNIGAFFIGALIILNTAEFPRSARITVFALSLVFVAITSVFVYNIFRKNKVFARALKLFGLHRHPKWRKIKKGADDVETLIERFVDEAPYFRRAMLINAGLWCLMFVEYKLALAILGYDASLYGIFLFLTGVGIAYSIPIPAALGVLELGQIGAGALLGVRASVGVALAFLVRVRDIAWTVIGLFLLWAFHMNVFGLLEKSQEMVRRHSIFEVMR